MIFFIFLIIGMYSKLVDTVMAKTLDEAAFKVCNLHLGVILT